MTPMAKFVNIFGLIRWINFVLSFVYFMRILFIFLLPCDGE